MLKLRRVSQLIFLFLFVYLFFKASFPYESIIPADIFLRADPLIAIITILTTKQFIFGMFFLAFIILFITIFLGRVFCGWICPLGTVIDVSDRLTSKERKKKPWVSKKYRLWKYSLLIIIFAAALFSLQLIWFFDPISLLTRSITLSIYPLFSYSIDAIFSVITKIEFLEDQIYTFYDYLRDTILPLKPLYFQKSLIIFTLFSTILLLGRLTKRFWCRYICPLGALYALFSKYRVTKRIVNDNCTNCGICLRNCKMNAIDDDLRNYSQFECIECMNCTDICPENAFEYKLNFKKVDTKLDITRRRLIFSGIGGLLTVGLTKTAFVNKSNAGNVIRPPGSIPESEFLDRCIRCHECIKICSTTGNYLQPTLLESGWEGIWTPKGEARQGYCEFDCTLCGEVCPTQAIHKLDVKVKQNLPIGTAIFNKNRCIPWYRQEDCIVCEEHCPTYDKAIKFKVEKITKPDGTIREVKFPYVDEKLCVGCGVCVTKCPLQGKAGIFMTIQGEQRYSDD